MPRLPRSCNTICHLEQGRCDLGNITISAPQYRDPVGEAHPCKSQNTVAFSKNNLLGLPCDEMQEDISAEMVRAAISTGIRHTEYLIHTNSAKTRPELQPSSLSSSAHRGGLDRDSAWSATAPRYRNLVPREKKMGPSFPRGDLQRSARTDLRETSSMA